MILRDQFRYAFGNLLKTRLRTTLTAAGVAVGIGAMTSMVSVGLGTQRTIIQAFNEGNILTSVLVRSVEGSDGAADETPPALDSTAVEHFRDLPRVRDVYPLLTISGLLQYGEEELFRNLEGMPARMLAEQIEHGTVEVLAGRGYVEGETDVIVLSERAAKILVPDSVDLDSLLGKTAVFNAARSPGLPNIEQVISDSLPPDVPSDFTDLVPMLRTLPIAGMIGSMPMGMFEPVRLELTVVGVVRGGGSLTDFVGLSLWVPIEVVEPLHTQTFQNLESILTGRIGDRGYPMVQILTSDVLAVRNVQDTIKAMG